MFSCKMWAELGFGFGLRLGLGLGLGKSGSCGVERAGCQPVVLGLSHLTPVRLVPITALTVSKGILCARAVCR